MLTDAVPTACRRGVLRCLLAGVVIACVAGPAGSQHPVRNVLILQSADRGFRVLDRFTENFKAELASRAAGPVSISQFVVKPSGFAAVPDETSVEYLRAVILRNPKPDLVVTVAGTAATFARRYRQELFPDTPLLLSAVDVRFLTTSPRGDNEATVAVDVDYSLLIDDILQLLPRTKTVFMVMDAGPFSQVWRPELERAFRRFDGRLTFVWSEPLTYDEILQQTASLPADSAIVYIVGGAYARGGSQTEERAFADLSKVNTPLFGVMSPWLGMGIVGGRLVFTEQLGPSAATAALRVLNGEPAGSIDVEPVKQGPAAFDARQLSRFGIPESRLPANSRIEFRPRSLWQDYRREVLAVFGVVTVQGLLIAGLAYQRQARRRAEIQSRTNLALAADANRRVAMSAMTGSIAHELSQPLNAIQHNAQAGEMLIGSNRGTPDELKEILSDIRAANVRASQIIERHRTMLKSREVEHAPVDLRDVVREGVAVVGHEMSSRQVQVLVNLPSAPCVVQGDRVLLQQVIVNILMNALDAMAGTPPERRGIRVSGEFGAGTIDVAIRDGGSGLAADFGGRVFEPFVTTKRHGLGIGLTIARSIIEAHGGTMSASNNPDGGATFTVTLPCGAIPVGE
jgi:signal transduction histidine kinase